MDLQSTIQRVGVAVVVAMCMLLPGVTWAKEGPPENNPGRPFAELFAQNEEILAQQAILNEKLDELLAHGVDLRGVTQNWDKKLPADDGDACDSSRFTCVLDGQAVRDNETGIVWKRVVTAERFEWGAAIEHCAQQEVADRFGWHLPTFEQLASLLDNTATGPVALPDGHPFVGVQPSNFWSATVEVKRLSVLPQKAWIVVTSVPPLGHVGVQPITPADRNTVFCVRGGQAYDGQDIQRAIDALP